MIFHALAYFILIRRFQYDSIVRIGTIELGITRSIEGYDRYVLADSYVHRTTVIRNEERASFIAAASSPNENFPVAITGFPS